MSPQKDQHQHHRWEQEASDIGLPMSLAQTTLVAYRSVGIGVFGAVMRFVGMPLEKIALYMNSSQVRGKAPFQQAVKLTFQEGLLSPYKVVGPASLTAWFLQYSVMGVAFQFFDQGLSQALGVKPVAYGQELMQPPPAPSSHEQNDATYNAKAAVARLLSPVLAASMESFVSNRAEAQRFFGPQQFVNIERKRNANMIARAAGPGFAANATRNIVMVNTSFLLTPVTFHHFYPQELKSQGSLFWYGLSMNIFVGNVVAITQQALWGRSMDYLREHGHVSYRGVIAHGLKTEGLAAFFTVPKWCSRVLMNAPAQGTLPWFYNEVLPWGEPVVMRLVNRAYLAQRDASIESPTYASLQSRPTRIARKKSNLEKMAEQFVHDLELEPRPSGFTPCDPDMAIHGDNMTPTGLDGRAPSKIDGPRLNQYDGDARDIASRQHHARQIHASSPR